MYTSVHLRDLGVIADAELDLAPGLNVITGETGAGKTMLVHGLGLLLGSRSDAELVRTGATQAIVEGRLELAEGHPALARVELAGGQAEPIGATGPALTTSPHDDAAQGDSRPDAEGYELILSRAVTSAGRSRGYAGGRSVPAGVLTEVGEASVAVHGQADQWRLRSAREHRELLDRFGGPEVSDALAAYRAVFEQRTAAVREAAALRAAERDRGLRIDRLTAALEEIERLDPKPGEDADLAEQEERLAHADDLRSAADRARGWLGDDDAAGGDGPGLGARDRLARAAGEIGQLAAHDERLADLSGRARELSVLADELLTDLAGYAQDIEVDPARLEIVQERRAVLARLVRRYASPRADGRGDDRPADGAGEIAHRVAGSAAATGDEGRGARGQRGGIDEVLSWSAQAARELDSLQHADERVSVLDSLAAELTDQLGTAAARLHEARTAAAHRLGEAITAELDALAMGSATVSVAVEPDRVSADGLPSDDGLAPEDGLPAEGGSPAHEPTDPIDVPGIGLCRPHAHGIDDVELRLAANSGAAARSIAKAASGGELSRVMLAIEVVTAAPDPLGVRTFVFDEVDAGVGGAAGRAVGARLAALATTAQVIVVTHLAQVAAFADRHLVVRKSDDGTVTASAVHAVDGDDRLAELARLMSGDEGTEQGLRHARDLLDAAAETRAQQASAGPGIPRPASAKKKVPTTKKAATATAAPPTAAKTRRPRP